jgi:mono/diheme cytochrome c family protein
LVTLVAGTVMAAFYFAVQAQTAAIPTRSVWDGVYIDAQASRGAQIYLSDCASCHGKQLNGIDDAPALAGKEFIDSWDGRTLSALLAQMRKMPRDSPGRLSSAEYADTMAYILSVNKFPAGKVDLPQEAEVLRQIRLEATKSAPAKPASKK